MSFPRYPAYKDSGVDWLGDVPVHWAVARMKHAVDSVKNGIWGDEPRGDENDIACVRVADFDRVGLCVSLDEPTIRNVLPSERTGRVLQRGDLLLEKSGGGEQQPVGCVVLYDHDHPAVCSNFVARVTVSQDADASFLRYTHSAVYSLRVNTKSVKQTSGIQNLDSQAYFDELGPFPPLPEQRAIAAFLDRETTKIDALVAQQRRLMDLLREKRQALISHAVTKGLNPDAPMKDSGVEWLGEVPAHWAVTPLARATIDRCDGPFGSGLKSEHYTDNGVRVIRLQNIKRTGFEDSDAAFIDPAYYAESLGGHDVVAGDLLIAGLGDDKNVVGRACVAPEGIEPAMVKADCFRFRLNGRHAVPDFVAHQLNASAAVDAGRLATGTTRSRIPLSAMGSRRIALPPLHEQMTITSFLAERITETAKLGEQVLRAASLLEERRTALITAAVTGQIDVRSLALSEAV